MIPEHSETLRWLKASAPHGHVCEMVCADEVGDLPEGAAFVVFAPEDDETTLAGVEAVLAKMQEGGIVAFWLDGGPGDLVVAGEIEGLNWAIAR